MRKIINWIRFNIFSISFTTLIIILYSPPTTELNVRSTPNQSFFNTSLSGEVKKRVKRVVWYSNRRFIMPLGSYIILAPQLQLPLVRQAPTGLNANMQLGTQFFMRFDDLGWTSDRHPWPPAYPFGRGGNGSSSGNSTKSESTQSHSSGHRKKKSILSLPGPENFHGGERAYIFPRIENLLSSFGFDGRPCLLRAVCEIHQVPLVDGYGLFGEFITLFFTVSQSMYAETHLPQYLKSELDGKDGDCMEYSKSCPKSIFSTRDSKRHYK